MDSIIVKVNYQHFMNQHLFTEVNFGPFFDLFSLEKALLPLKFHDFLANYILHPIGLKRFFKYTSLIWVCNPQGFENCIYLHFCLSEIWMFNLPLNWWVFWSIWYKHISLYKSLKITTSSIQWIIIQWTEGANLNKKN